MKLIVLILLIVLSLSFGNVAGADPELQGDANIIPIPRVVISALAIEVLRVRIEKLEARIKELEDQQIAPKKLSRSLLYINPVVPSWFWDVFEDGCNYDPIFPIGCIPEGYEDGYSPIRVTW